MPDPLDLHQALRERDTALARVAELEAQYDVLRDAFDQATASNEVGARALHAAETALASAREELERKEQQRIGFVHKWEYAQTALYEAQELLAETVGQPGVWNAYWLARRDALLMRLTSRPAPVAAPCVGCTSARTAITEALRLYAGGHEHGDVLRAWLAKAELARRAARKESKP